MSGPKLSEAELERLRQEKLERERQEALKRDFVKRINAFGSIVQSLQGGSGKRNKKD